MKRKTCFVATLALLSCMSSVGFASPSMADTKAKQQIAKDAFIYGFPLVMNYGVMYSYFIDKNSSLYKTGFNQIYNEANVYTPKDTAIVTPNSDTPYSYVPMDLRAEPVVLCVPEVEKGRYYSVMLTDMYTFNYGYIGSRATGNRAGCYAIAGPRWKGNTPAGIKKVFHSETELSIAAYRTQLFNPGDIENVKKVQAGYKVQTLSRFLNRPAPSPAPKIKWLPINKQMAQTNPFAYVNFVLQFCPAIGPASVERPLRAQFAQIGVEAGKPFDLAKLSPNRKAALVAGMKSGMESIKKKSVTLGTIVNGWQTGLNSGDRVFYHGDWLFRAGVALAGIYANDAIEALYPTTHVDSTGAELNASTGRYTITFPAGQLPPATAFWSVTMYDGKSQLLVANPIKRYLINSPMLPNLKKNGDGSVTLYVQKDSPGADKESNWLPAPNDTFYMVTRIYWPKQAALDGAWKPPAVQKAQ